MYICISGILEFWNLTWNITKFRKIRIFEHNSALNYSMGKKFHMWGLDLNTYKTTFGDFAIFEFNDKSGFSNVISLQITPV